MKVGGLNLIRFTEKGLKTIYREGYHYKKAGVIVMGLTPDTQKQFALFTTENSKHDRLMPVIDPLNRAYGNKKIKCAAQSLGRQWKMKQEKLSPRYSTNIKEVITVFT